MAPSQAFSSLRKCPNIFSDLRKPGLVPGKSLSLSTKIDFVLEKYLSYKGYVVLDDFKTNAVDLSVLTETWLDNTENDKARLLSSPLNTDGLKIYTKNRIGNKGGGIALVSRDKYKVNTLDLAETDGFEAQV